MFRVKSTSKCITVLAKKSDRNYYNYYNFYVLCGCPNVGAGPVPARLPLRANGMHRCLYICP